MLGDWALDQGGWKKKLAWRAYQKADLLAADAFHATSHQEGEEIRKLGFLQPIAIIPNGIVFPKQPIENMRLSDRSSRSVLFLSRIHPKKGLLKLLNSWKEANVPDNWKLVLAGPDEGGHQREVQALARNLDIESQISFPGAVSDEEKWDLYFKSHVFVLPSFSENFGIVVAEALAAGLPVIATEGTPWQAINEKEAGWFVPHEVSSLAAAIRAATTIDDSSGKRSEREEKHGHARCLTGMGLHRE